MSRIRLTFTGARDRVAVGRLPVGALRLRRRANDDHKRR
jgi:hypothetical protein